MDAGGDEIESALDQLFQAYDLDELGPVLTDCVRISLDVSCCIIFNDCVRACLVFVFL